MYVPLQSINILLNIFAECLHIILQGDRGLLLIMHVYIYTYVNQGSCGAISNIHPVERTRECWLA